MLRNSGVIRSYILAWVSAGRMPGVEAQGTPGPSLPWGTMLSVVSGEGDAGGGAAGAGGAAAGGGRGGGVGARKKRVGPPSCHPPPGGGRAGRVGRCTVADALSARRTSVA